ncbi:MAG: hypothetical protein AAGK32_08455, partial [Actinomycetota bacterium]
RLAGVGGLLGRTLSLIGDCRPELVGPVRTNRLASTLSFMTQSLATRATRLDRGDAAALDAETFESEIVSMILGLVTAPTKLEAPAPQLAGSATWGD